MTESGPMIVVGLGNPGPTYEKTRHNVGFFVIDVLAKRAGGRLTGHKKSGAEVLQARLGGRSVILAKPTSFMNLSGRTVGILSRFYSAASADIVIVHDELDLELGTVRLKRGGGEGGHNGLRSVSSALTTKDYTRVRVGIGRPPGRQDPADFVLKAFSSGERTTIDVACETAADAIEMLVTHGLEATQNLFHQQGKM